MKKIPKLWRCFRVLDVLISPFMWLFNKCRMERPQETHMWHCIPWDISLQIDMAIHFEGGYKRKSRFSPFFHIPLFGTGWENYIVVQPSNYAGRWFIGWEISGADRKQELNLLVLKDGEPVRVLVSSVDIIFFALDDQGTQLKLRKIGEGRLGDLKFANVRQL